MKKLVRFAMGPFVVLVAMGLIAGCDGAGGPAKPANTAKPADAPKPAATAPAAAVTPMPAPAPMEEKKPENAAPASTPAAPAAAPGPAIDAKTIIGTKWNVAGYTLAFQENGVVKINDDTEGTWKIDGNKLTIEASGTTYDATLEGDKIMYEGSPFEKL
jgi:heat shock protein HslJ